MFNKIFVLFPLFHSFNGQPMCVDKENDATIGKAASWFSKRSTANEYHGICPIVRISSFSIDRKIFSGKTTASVFQTGNYVHDFQLSEEYDVRRDEVSKGVRHRKCPGLIFGACSNPKNLNFHIGPKNGTQKSPTVNPPLSRGCSQAFIFGQLPSKT